MESVRERKKPGSGCLRSAPGLSVDCPKRARLPEKTWIFERLEQTRKRSQALFQALSQVLSQALKEARSRRGASALLLVPLSLQKLALLVLPYLLPTLLDHATQLASPRLMRATCHASARESDANGGHAGCRSSGSRCQARTGPARPPGYREPYSSPRSAVEERLPKTRTKRARAAPSRRLSTCRRGRLAITGGRRSPS